MQGTPRRIAVAFGSALVVLAASTATAQEAKIEATGFIGYTLSEGIETDPGSFVSELVEAINPTSGLSYGAGVGFFVNEYAQIGFQWSQQDSKLELDPVGSLSKRDLADMKVNNYHGVFTYFWEDILRGSDTLVQPFIFGGLGATNYSPDAIMGTNVDGHTKFSTTWGAGVKVYPNPRLGVNFTARWTPTYIKSGVAGEPYCSGYWTPYYPSGCVSLPRPDYSNQFELVSGISLRF